MKTVQKLEIGFGLATFAATLISILVIFLPVIRNDGRDFVREYLLAVFLLGVPAVLTGGGSVIHATRQSRAAFTAILFGASVLVIIYGINLFSLGIFYFFGWVGGFIASIPGLLAALTIFFALRSRKSDSFIPRHLS